ncbi:unnamed protein product [Aphanomyces euteiches]
MKVPVLRRTSFSIHLQFALQPSAFPRQDKLAKPYISSPFTDPFQGNAVEGPALVVVNIYVKELNFSLSDRQVQMLIDVTIVATSKQRSVQENENTEQYQSAVPPSPKIAPKPTSQPPPPENSTSWSSWAMGMLVGSEALYEDELEQELLKGIADQTPPPPPAEEAERVDEANLSTLHLVVVRVSIQRASLTLRCHENNADDQVDIPTEMLPIEFVPVANMGLVQVAAHSKTKISKAATPIAILHVQDALVSWCTNQIVRDLAIDIAGLSTVEATPDGRQLLVAGSFDAPRSQDLKKGRQLVVVEGESYCQPLFGEIEMPIADNCTCHDASYNLPSIVDFWVSTLENFKQAQPKAWENRILEVIESKFKWPRKRLQSIERHLCELSHAYDQNSIWNHVLPVLVLSTAQFANHSCCSRAKNSAIRLRLVENDDTTSPQMDMSFGTININVSTSSIATGDAFVGRLTLPPQRTSKDKFVASKTNSCLGTEPTDSTDTVGRRFLVHVSHATAQCSTDDGPFASVHVANCLVSIDQSAKKQSIVLDVGNLGGMVSNVDVVEITSAHAALTWSLTSPECIDHCAFEAAINQIKVHAFAEAVGIADIDQAKLVNPLVFWQFLSSLVQQATSNPPPQQVALQPILCTLHSFAPLSYENVVLSLFGRNYGNPPYDGFFHGYMEAVDIFLSLPALSALVSFAIPIAKLFPPSKSLEKSNEKLFQPHVNFQMEPLRVIFPDGMIVCVEGVHVDTSPFVDFSMEGLRSPPFTPLTKKAKANRPTVYPDSGIKMIGRINNLYAAVTSWALSSDNDPSLGPYEIGLARLKSQPCILLTKVDYVLRPLLVSVESTAQISLHMTKMSVDLPYHRFLNILNKVDEIIGVIPKNWPESPPRIVEKSQALGCRIALDGFELNLINDKTSIHTRVGSVAFSHSLPPTDQGSFSIKNIVIGFRDGSSSSEEMLICGPFADPTEWQLAVEKYPDQIISATWSIQAGMLTGLVELQGVQCHVSPQFVNSLVAFIKPLVRHETPQRSTRDFTLRRFDPRTNVSVLGFIQQSKIKLLGAPSVVTLESPDAQIAAVLTLGSIFASLHVGYDSTEVNSVAKMGHSALHQYLPLKYMDYMCTVQTLRMQMLRGYTSLNVPLVAKFNRPDWSDFERAWTKRQQVPLIDDVQVRLTGDVNQVLLPFEMQVMDGAYLIDMQIETTPIESALCFETWSILDALVRNVQENIESSASVSQHVEDKYEQEPSVELSPPTANDFMELDQSLQPRQHPSSGELVFLGEIDQDDKADIPPMMRVMNSVSEDFESLLHCVNEPWESCSSSPASLRWKYHLPRRVVRIVASPLPMPSFDLLAHGWPHFETTDSGTRLCDVLCDLRCWNMTQNAYSSVGTFYVPWEEPLREEPGGSFASALRSWVADDPNENERERLLKSTFTTREFLPSFASAHQWELRWRVPNGAKLEVLFNLLEKKRVNIFLESDVSNWGVTGGVIAHQFHY